jgi:hypothetical protein
MGVQVMIIWYVKGVVRLKSQTENYMVNRYQMKIPNLAE